MKEPKNYRNCHHESDMDILLLEIGWVLLILICFLVY